MRVIGITGGVGSGKSMILAYLKEHYDCGVLLADQAANELKEPGKPCYEPIIKLLGKDILDEEGKISKDRMAAKIFGNDMLRKAVNAIIHPVVKEYITGKIRREREKGRTFFFLEAALLIECGYDSVVDEMWYIYADSKTRRQRLKDARGYSDEKISGILKAQLPEDVFRKHCDTVIDNNGTRESACEQIEKKMGEYLWEK